MSKFEIKNLIKFAIVGAIGTIENLLILFFLTDLLKIYYIFSAIVAIFLSVLSNYLLNKWWTFREEIKDRILKKYIQYVLLYSASLLVNISILYVLVEFFQVWYIIAELCAIICAFFMNFFGSMLWIFKKDHATNKKNLNS